MKINYVEEVKECYYKNGSLIKAIPMKHYMRDQFEYVGIQTPLRRKISAPFLKKDKLPPVSELEPIIREFWKLEGREFQYFGQELAMKYEKVIPETFISTFEFMILTKSWWDTIDIIAKKLVGQYIIRFPEKRNDLLEKWLLSENIWLQRTCLLFQLGYKQKTDAECLFQIIERLKTVDEFFIQKAIGWALREYSKVNPDRVMEYLKRTNLSKLAYTNALRNQDAKK
ncbi:MAG: DNA alkylation repair protein [Thermotogota bacterium]